MKPALPEGIYGITGEKFSRGRSIIEVARAMTAGGCRIIQYREKRPDKTFAEMLHECRAIRQLTREAGVIFIVNDYPGLAMLADADGVHVGQDDFPPAEVRRLLGPDKLIGLSTHSPEQERAARQSGADYIGAGPVFATQTKSDVCDAVGFSYLDYVAENSPLPFVAIGGIKEGNIGEVLAHGAKTIALVTEIVSSDDIAATVRRLRGMWRK
ncbi:MAG TPA: thiamine phosphate synthase [Desulfobulbaceae bacterium]|nr:thiamine phosphate synthase [Desulfobulbaceae bacterium]